MAVPEIIIAKPDFNNYYEASWSDGNQEHIEVLDFWLAYYGVNPATHPLAADLCAGTGAIASRLIEKGWRPEDITCFDQAVPFKPMVQDVQWRYWDLSSLGNSLLAAREMLIPAEVQGFRSRFNLITLWGGFLGKKIEKAVGHYLLKPGGVMIASSSLINGLGPDFHSR